MLEFRTHIDKKDQKTWIETPLKGKSLLTTPLLNKGTAFTLEERLELELLGKLPNRVESLSDQVARAYLQYHQFVTPLQKHIFLRNLHDQNEILFYRLVGEHLEQMLRNVYTPGVGDAVKAFSSEFRQPRGLYIAYPDEAYIDRILDNRTHPDIRMIVVTDGEGVLGIGDQGIGAMDIPIAKLMVYSLCGLNPYQSLPVMLDLGTNNETLLNDPLYLGWRHPRVTGADYDRFLDKFVKGIKKRFPSSCIHWEDFGRSTARVLLDRYREEICSFNDDMQGTGAVCLGACLAAIRATQSTLAAQRIVIFGAGTAGVGIADQIKDAMIRNGLSADEASGRIWLIDRHGLVLTTDETLTVSQAPYAKGPEHLKDWPRYDGYSLELVVEQVKPTMLIGCSTATGAFNQAVVQTMAKHVDRPIIFPLSNPNEKAEAMPQDVLQWTEGRGIIATGSPFPPVIFNDQERKIAQCNNALAFPGIGLGALAVKATTITDNMLNAAARAIADSAPIQENPLGAVLPALSQVRELAFKVAVVVAQQALDDGVGQLEEGLSAESAIGRNLWWPRYLDIHASKP